jgi:two-component system OmpR family sensor kinase
MSARKSVRARYFCPRRTWGWLRNRQVSLRIRLVRTLLLRLVLALTLADAATSWAVYGLLLRNLDAQLSATSVLADQYVIAAHNSHQQPDLNGTASTQWGDAANAGLLPALMEMRLTDGSVQQIGAGPPITAQMKPGPDGTGTDADGAAFYTGTVSAGGGSVTYRIRVSHLPDGEGTLVLATSEHQVSATMEQLGLIEAITWLGAFCFVGWMSSRRIRKHLRPFERMGDQIVAIGSGDLDQRVSPADPDTELGRVGHSVNLMLTRLEHSFNEQRASEGRLRRFIADASHELRTPLSSIRGYAELFRRGASSRPEDLALAMRRIESEASRMGVLVDELLLLARLDSGRPLERAVVDLGALLHDAARDALAADARWPVGAEVDESAGPVHVIGDVDRLSQVLTNLLSNVRAHTPPGTAATISARREQNSVLLEVADDGPGLTERQQLLVFERFYRADASRGRGDGTGGSGLGLSIVASVAEAHGGSATVRSAPGSGAVFSVRLPVAGTAVQPPETAAAVPAPRDEAVPAEQTAPDAGNGAVVEDA